MYLQLDIELNGRKCRDRLVIYEHYLPRNYPNLFSVVPLDIIDSSLNGKQLVYRTNNPTLHIWFYACIRKDKLLKQGGGFRAVVRDPGTVVIQMPCLP